MERLWANPKSAAILKHGNVGHKQHARPTGLSKSRWQHNAAPRTLDQLFTKRIKQMSTGVFINFNLPYLKGGVYVSDLEQADIILKEATNLISKGAKGLAITYSANYGQTRKIEQVYSKGGWNTQTTGGNQAAVMACMESLLGSKYQALQGKMRIAPITTMNAYPGDNPINPWNENVLMNIVIKDLERIKTYLDGNWDVLGWQNQGTVGNPKHPYAVGGGIATLPQAVSDKIQNTLIGYAKTYPEK
jgi:hypothetical protein